MTVAKAKARAKATPRRAPAKRAGAKATPGAKPKAPVKAGAKAKPSAGLMGTTPAGGEVRGGAEPMGTTPGGGHVRSGPSTVGNTPGGGEVHHVTTRKSGEKPAPRPSASSEEDEATEEEDEEEAEAGAEAEADGEELELEEEFAEPSVTDGRGHPVESAPAPEREPAPAPSPGVTAATALMATARTSLQLAKAVASQALSSERLGRAFRMAAGLGAAVRTGLGMGGGTHVDDMGKDADLSAQLQPLADFLYDRYWRVTVLGADLVPEGGAMLVANHSGAVPVDGPVLHLALQRERPDLKEARWLVEDQVFHAPFLGTLFNRIGAVRACPENAQRLLEEGRPVIVFPEGIQGIGKPFQQRYQLKRLGRGGFAKLAVSARVPIVPVAVVGAEESLPLLAKLPARFLGLPYLPVTLPPLPAKWTIRFGEPIRTSGVDPATAEDPAAIQPLVDQTRGAIEGMLRAILDERKSVFRG
jgi:1-acyl-sn-glycerol-3-phosphate acyltransferase